MAEVVLVFEPLPLVEVVLEPDVVPVAAVVVPEVVVPDVAVPDVVVAELVVADAVVPDVDAPTVLLAGAEEDVVVVDVVEPVRSTEPVPLPVDAEILVDVLGDSSLELPPIEPQALKVRAQASERACNANTRAPAILNRLNNIHPVQRSWLLNSM